MKRPRRRTKISAYSTEVRRPGKSSCVFTSADTAVARLAPLVRKTLPSVTVPVLLLLDLLCECPHHLYAATSPGFGARAERGGGVVVRYAWIARGRVIGEADSRVVERGMVGSKRRWAAVPLHIAPTIPCTARGEGMQARGVESLCGWISRSAGGGARWSGARRRAGSLRARVAWIFERSPRTPALPRRAPAPTTPAHCAAQSRGVYAR
ncbi:hypothetical protein B0H13DRAFT_509357 [Mycena leptocephala]|nr:hypothetical protein B0H13DRAFT_509357 [Mycena leptocephala]